MVTPPELKIVCFKSNEINDEHFFVLLTAEKKFFAFDKVGKNYITHGLFDALINSTQSLSLQICL